MSESLSGILESSKKLKVQAKELNDKYIKM